MLYEVITATVAKPKLLLLDEHTAALDPVTSAQVMDTTRRIVADSGLTALMITHDMELALGCGNRTLLMDSGRVVLDVSGAERAALTPQALVELFRARSGHGLSDRTLLS